MTDAIKSRRPTGAVPAPCILLEGEEKSGKSWQIALLSASEKVGATYWLDLGEGTADEYGAIPGARFQVIEHDGSYRQIVAQVQAVHAEAARAREAGEKPVVLGFDSMTLLWDGLKDWASQRAAKSDSNRRKLAADPNAEVTVTSNLWNDAGSRHARVMTLLLTFPGIVVMTARGKQVVEVENGKPVEGSKVWKVEGHKNLPFDASVWVRMFRDHAPQLIGARSVHAGRVPGKDKPLDLPDFTVERLIFDLLQYNGGAPRELRQFSGGAPDDAVQDILDDIPLAEDEDDLAALWRRAKALDPSEEQVNRILAAWTTRRDEIRARSHDAAPLAEAVSA